jgi:hypothetical protein
VFCANPAPACCCMFAIVNNSLRAEGCGVFYPCCMMVHSTSCIWPSGRWPLCELLVVFLESHKTAAQAVGFECYTLAINCQQPATKCVVLTVIEAAACEHSCCVCVSRQWWLQGCWDRYCVRDLCITLLQLWQMCAWPAGSSTPAVGASA